MIIQKPLRRFFIFTNNGCLPLFAKIFQCGDDFLLILYTPVEFSASWHKRGETGCERGLTGKEKSDTSLFLVSLYHAISLQR